MGKKRFLSNVSKESANSGIAMPWSRGNKAGGRRRAG